MRLRWVILIAAAIVVALMVADYAHGQTVQANRIRFSPTTNSTPPSGFFNFYIDQATGLLVCRNDAGGSCLPAGGGGGSGTVTSFSAGNLSPLFTSSVATPTTTPALTFTLSNAAANTVFGNNTGSTAAPAFVSLTDAMVPDSITISLAAAATALAANGTNCSAGNYPLGVDASGNVENCTAASGAGTVTSVALALPTEFTISGSPVTTTGTLTGAWATQTAAKFFAAPTGSTGVPSFRIIAAADIPTLNQSTSGNAATATALAADGTNCSAGNYPLGVDASGNVQSCTAASGAGTVTSFSAGNLSPLFTTSVATATTTPALTFSLSTAAAHTFFGNNTGSTAAPAFSAITDADVPDNITIALAAAATALNANGGNCSGNNFALGVDASGVAECAQPAFTNLSGTATKAQQHAATVYNDAANTWSTGIQDFSATTALRIKTGSGVPAGTACDAAGEVGSIYIRNDANATNSSFYVCSQTAVTPTFAWELAQGAGGGGAGASGHYIVTVADANTNEVVDTPGAGLERRINETDSNGGPYTTDFNPNDPSYFWIREEFCGGLTSTGNIGDNGWVITNIVVAPTMSAQIAPYPNLCLARMSTGAASGNGGTLSPGGLQFMGNLSANTNWEVIFVFRLNLTTTESFRIGLVAALNAIEPTAGMWLRYDTNLADAAFKVETRSASTSTVGGTTYTVNTSFHKIRIRSTTAGTIVFTFDGNADQTLSTNVPTVDMQPAIVLATRTTVARTVDVDFFSLKIRGLTR